MDFDTFYTEEVFVRACELVGPNDPDFHAVLERVTDDMAFESALWVRFMTDRVAYMTPEQVDQTRSQRKAPL